MTYQYAIKKLLRSITSCVGPGNATFPPDSSRNIFAKIGMTKSMRIMITTTATPMIVAG